MSQRKPRLLKDLTLSSRLDALRTTLAAKKFAERLKLPLGFWAIEGDRCLPLALMGRSAREVLDTPYEAISKTPGVGEKKIATLLTLLVRIADDMPHAAASPQHNGSAARKTESQNADEHHERMKLSERNWSLWCETIRRAGLEQERLGRLALSLCDLPRILWHSPLATYCDCTLGDIRRMKTHGEKRVRAIAAIFHRAHVLCGAGERGHLTVRLAPAFVSPLESWIVAAAARPAGATLDEVAANLIDPLVRQLAHDTSEVVGRLTVARLGIQQPPRNIVQLARETHVTRARVYQLLDECREVMEVRWPEGGLLMAGLQRHLAATSPEAAQLVARTREAFYPQHGAITPTIDPETSAATVATGGAA